MLTQFFTCVTKGRIPIFTKTDSDFVQIITDSIRFFSHQEGFLLHEACIMPNHVHLLYSLPDMPFEFQIRFLRFTTKKIVAANEKRDKAKKIDFETNRIDRKNMVWRKRSKAIHVGNEQTFFAVRNYIRNNATQEHWKEQCCLQHFPDIKMHPHFPSSE